MRFIEKLKQTIMKLENVFDTIRHSGQPILDGFDDAQDVFDNFEVSLGERPLIDIICANYENEDYSGSATVFYYRRDTEKYYETYGSHCSCYGLEDQWDMEEIVFVELEKRLAANNFFGLRERLAGYRG